MEKLGIVIVALFLSLQAMSQNYHLDKAGYHFSSGSLEQAIAHYKKAYNRIDQTDAGKKLEIKGFVSYQMGRCYQLRRELEQAKMYMERAHLLKYDAFDPELLYDLGTLCKMQGDYTAANRYFTLYSEQTGKDKGKDALEGCTTAAALALQKSRFRINPDYQLNTGDYEFSPAFVSRKYDQISFTSNRPDEIENKENQRTGGQNKDIWIVEKDRRGHWKAPVALNRLINSDNDEGTAVIDGRDMYFTRCIHDKHVCHGCDIYHSLRKGSDWAEPERIELKPDGETCWSVKHPALLNNGRSIIFSGDLPGGLGGHDLWITHYDQRSRKWLEPVNLGPEINSPYNELFPYVRDNGTLYFASDKPSGLGGLDIYSASYRSAENWEMPVNMGVPINSVMDDFAITFEGESDRGYLSSNRDVSRRDDIYAFHSPPIIFGMEVVVMDYQTKAPVNNAIVTLTDSEGKTVTARTDVNGQVVMETAKDGSRIVKRNEAYLVEVWKEKEYLKGIQRFSTAGDRSEKYVYEFLLHGDDVIRLPEVHYDFDSAVLQVNSKVNSHDSLDYLYDLMMQNPNTIIELRSHTDCRGDAAYNLELSENRAKSCVEYLVNIKGIPAGRLIPLGIGESQPLEGLSCEEISELPTKEERESAHQLNRRTDCRVVSWDYKSE